MKIDSIDSIFPQSLLNDLQNQASIEEDLYQDEQLIQLYERRKIDNNSGLKELKLLQAKDKIWLNVDNLFMRQNVEQTIRYIQEDQEYLNSEIKQIKQRILSQTKKLKLLQNKNKTRFEHNNVNV